MMRWILGRILLAAVFILPVALAGYYVYSGCHCIDIPFYETECNVHDAPDYCSILGWATIITGAIAYWPLLLKDYFAGLVGSNLAYAATIAANIVWIWILAKILKKKIS